MGSPERERILEAHHKRMSTALKEWCANQCIEFQQDDIPPVDGLVMIAEALAFHVDVALSFAEKDLKKRRNINVAASLNVQEQVKQIRLSLQQQVRANRN